MEKRQIKYNITPRYEQIKFIVVHDTGNPDTGANAERHYAYFNGGNRDSSADIFVDDTKAIRVNDYLKFYTWHCGDGHGKYGITNSNSVGVEMCVNRDGDFDKAFNNTVLAVRQLMAELNIPIDRVVRHYDASRKNCPQSFNKNGWALWYEFKRRLTSKEELTDMQYDELRALIKAQNEVINEQQKAITALEKKIGGQSETYDYIDDNMPSWARNDVKWAKDKGIIVGDENGKLGLTPIKLWTLAIVLRVARYVGNLVNIKI